MKQVACQWSNRQAAIRKECSQQLQIHGDQVAVREESEAVVCKANLRLSDSALAWSSEDGEVVALDLHDAHYVGVNRSGARLWSLLAVGTTRAELVTLLEEAYGLPNDRAAQDVDAFLAVCRDRGYLEQ